MPEEVSVPGLISIVVPVFGAPAVEALTERIEALFRDSGEGYEIIFVDDGTPDARVWPMLERLVREHEHVRAVQLTRNFGQHAATLCGMREARGEVIITMDDDLQHDPADIRALLAERHHDIVIGQIARSEHHLLRRMATAVKRFFDRLLIGTPKGLHLTSFRLLRRPVVEGVLSMRAANPFLPPMMFHVSRDAVGVPVSHSPRAAGRSGYTLRKLFAMFGDLVINNSSILLRTAAMTGIVFAGVSFVLAAIVIYHKLVHDIAVQGWASLFAATMLVGGVLLISVGIIGEYLIRIIESSEARPIYFVRRRSG